MIWFEFIKDKALLNFYLWRVWNIWITASVVTHLSSNCNRLSLENRTTVDRIDTFYPLTSHGGLYPKFDCMSHLFILRIVEGRLLLEWESLEYTILSIGMDWTGLVVPLLLILLLHGMSFLITQFLSSLIPSFIALSLSPAPLIETLHDWKALVRSVVCCHCDKFVERNWVGESLHVSNPTTKEW